MADACASSTAAPDPLVHLHLLGLQVRIVCADSAARELIAANFAAFPTPGPAAGSADLDYSITLGGDPPSFAILRGDDPVASELERSELLFRLEEDLTVQLQRKRADLLFLHAAALDWQGRTCVIAADSGVGKSTTAWGLLQQGLGYLSDELCPIDLETLHALPYPHALCMKQTPPRYPLPDRAIDLGRTIHVPTHLLPGVTIVEPHPLGAVFLLRREPEAQAPQLRVLGPAEAAARIYVAALNVLAHPNRGLDAVVRIAEAVPCYDVAAGELVATCTLIRSALANAPAAPPTA